MNASPKAEMLNALWVRALVKLWAVRPAVIMRTAERAPGSCRAWPGAARVPGQSWCWRRRLAAAPQPAGGRVGGSPRSLLPHAADWIATPPPRRGGFPPLPPPPSKKMAERIRATKKTTCLETLQTWFVKTCSEQVMRVSTILDAVHKSYTSLISEGKENTKTTFICHFQLCV